MLDLKYVTYLLQRLQSLFFFSKSRENILNYVPNCIYVYNIGSIYLTVSISFFNLKNLTISLIKQALKNAFVEFTAGMMLPIIFHASC